MVNGKPVRFIGMKSNVTCQYIAATINGQVFILDEFLRRNQVSWDGYEFSAIGFKNAVFTVEKNSENAI